MATESAQLSSENADSNHVLTFMLGDETFGVDILQVQEIRGWSTATRIPHAPPQVLGVLNLRGSIVPIVDLRKLFNLEHADYTNLTVVIVLSGRCENGTQEFGIVVDGVSDVVDIPPSDVKPAPEIGTHDAANYIRGIALTGESMILLVDFHRLTGLASEARTAPQPCNSELQAAAAVN